MVKGKTPAEAEELLAGYGIVEITHVARLGHHDHDGRRPADRHRRGRPAGRGDAPPPTARPTAAPSASRRHQMPAPPAATTPPATARPVTRLLGIDLGTRRVGLAIADEGDFRARPLSTMPRHRSLAADAEALARIVASNGIDELIVGLPLDMAGTEGAKAVEAREWALAVAQQTGLPVRLRDERLSSHVAESRVGAPGRGRAGGTARTGPACRASGAHRSRGGRRHPRGRARGPAHGHAGRARARPGRRHRRMDDDPRRGGAPGRQRAEGPAAADGAPVDAHRAHRGAPAGAPRRDGVGVRAQPSAAQRRHRRPRPVPRLPRDRRRARPASPSAPSCGR